MSDQKVDHNTALREQIVALLVSGDAHQSFDDALQQIPVTVRGTRPAGSPHSPWELLEHMRIAQWDILEFVRDADHVSPDFPTGYWPASAAPPTASAWDESVVKFRADRDSIADLVRDESADLFAKIPYGNATLLAQVLLASDHNTYHLGQIVLVGRMLAE